MNKNQDTADPVDFDGLRVVAFESRRSDELSHMISKFNGRAFVSASMQEIPIDRNKVAVDFAHRVLTGEINVVIFLTGVGFNYLLEAVSREIDRRRFLDTLSDIVTVCRGPKPAAAMKEVGLTPTYRVPEPNTWRELLTTLDENISIASQTVGVQEYGVENKSLVAGLEARGATVYPVKVYRWELPDETRLLEENVQRLVNEECDVVLFTSGNQLVNLLTIADQENCRDALLAGLRSSVVVSIGPTTTEMLQSNQIIVDL
ncbi:MAG: uroporphyrinogen-III synthase, partial [Planctomycetota bacterium]|nr:uroporphyrinogen-III synthase [Planctomycetota bacterium]